MSFDPSAVTVKEAVKQLSGLSDSELSEVYAAELDGKGRKSLLDEITAKRDALRKDVAPVSASGRPFFGIRR